MTTPARPLTRAERKQRALTLRGRQAPTIATGSVMSVREAGADRLRVQGYASTTGPPGYEMGFYRETVAAGAFRSTLARSPDVQFLINHDGLPLARTTNGTLLLREDGVGLNFTADLDSSDTDSSRVVSKIRDGLLTECSFAFRCVRDRWDDDYENREIQELDLHRGDVSVVTFGANPTTSVQALAARRAAATEAAVRVNRRMDYYRKRAYALTLNGRH